MFRFELIVNGERVDVIANDWTEALAQFKGEQVTMLCSVDLRPQTFLAW